MINLDVERKGHVVPQQLEARMGEQVSDVILAASEEIVDAEDVMAIRDQAVAEVRAEKTGAAGDEHTAKFCRTSHFNTHYIPKHKKEN